LILIGAMFSKIDIGAFWPKIAPGVKVTRVARGDLALKRSAAARPIYVIPEHSHAFVKPKTGSHTGFKPEGSPLPHALILLLLDVPVHACV